MNKILTCGELKMALKGLPNNMPVVLYNGEEKGNIYSPIWGHGFLGDPNTGAAKFTLYAKTKKPKANETLVDVMKRKGAKPEEIQMVQDMIDYYINDKENDENA